MTKQYYLASHVHFCLTIRYCIILDERTNRYLAISRDQADLLLGCLRRDIGSCPSSGTLTDTNRHLLADWLAHGLITEDVRAAKDLAPSDWNLPTLEISTVDGRLHQQSRWIDGALTLLNCAKADWLLHRNSLLRIVTRIRSRKRVARLAKEYSFDMDLALSLTHSFEALRYLYPRGRVCLFDSISLLEAMAARHLYPTLVFGVIDDPFQAHCWLQEGSTVLNDRLDFVRNFTPIMAV